MSSTGGKIRAAGVVARQALLGLASTKLGVPVDEPHRKQGRRLGRRHDRHLRRARRRQVAERDDPGRRVEHPPGRGRLEAGRASTSWSTTAVPRIDIPGKVTAAYTYVHNLRLPGMLHGRWVRPRGQGPYLTDGFAKPLTVDASSIAHIPDVKVVHVGDFVGVVGAEGVRRDPGRAAAEGDLGRLADPARLREPDQRSSARRTPPVRSRRASRATSASYDAALGRPRPRRCPRRSTPPIAATTRSARAARSPTGRPEPAAARTASRSTRTRRTSRAARRSSRRRSGCRSPTCASSSTRARARSATAGTRSTSPRRRRSCRARPARRCGSS